jgi:hypothetical protein
VFFTFTVIVDNNWCGGRILSRVTVNSPALASKPKVTNVNLGPLVTEKQQLLMVMAINPKADGRLHMDGRGFLKTTGAGALLAGFGLAWAQKHAEGPANHSACGPC